MLRGLEFFSKGGGTTGENITGTGVQVFNAFQTNGVCDYGGMVRIFSGKSIFLIGLSVDGTQEIHDAFRCGADGGGTYDRVKRTADLFSRMGVEFNVLTVVTSQLAEHTKRSTNRIGKRVAVSAVYCVPRPIWRKKGERPYSLLPQQYREFLSDSRVSGTGI